MSFYTSPASKFKFKALPGSDQEKKAFLTGFIKAVAEAPLSATEKVAWIKYANQAPPPVPPGADGGGDDDGGVEPVAGPGPGFVPEGAPEEQQIQQLLAALPGETIEDKLHAAAVALLEAQQAGAGDDSGVEDDGTGVEQGGGQLDPSIIQQLMSQQGPPQPAPGGPPPGGGQKPPPGAPPKGPQG